MLCSKLLLKKGAIKNKLTINSKLNNNATGTIDNTIFLPRLFSSLTNLDIATGSPKEQRVINKLNVGSIKEYNPIPLTDIILVSIIFINIPNILEINPPNISIIVDLTKLFFIINYM